MLNASGAGAARVCCVHAALGQESNYKTWRWDTASARLSECSLLWMSKYIRRIKRCSKHKGSLFKRETRFRLSPLCHSFSLQCRQTLLYRVYKAQRIYYLHSLIRYNIISSLTLLHLKNDKVFSITFNVVYHIE